MAAASPLHLPLPLRPRWSVRPGPGRWRAPLLGLLLASAVPLGVTTLRDTLESLAPPPPASVARGHVAELLRARELPREWRWAPSAVDAERMFRRTTAGVDARRSFGRPR